MRSIVGYFLDIVGLKQRAEAVIKTTGIDPFDLDTLTIGNYRAWLNASTTWLFFLENDYITQRTQSIQKKHPEYKPELALFIELFHDSPETSLAFLKKLDSMSLSATEEHFPDALFHQTLPPNGGPFYDLFSTLSKQQQTIPPSLLTTFNLSLALRLSKRPKDIVTLKNINKSDIEYLSAFLFYLSEHPQYQERISNYLVDENATLLMLVAFTPKHPVLTLRWDEVMVEQCFNNLFKTLDKYDKDPEIALALLQEMNEQSSHT